MQQLQNVIESAFERRADITPANVDTVTREAVNQVISLLDSGALRVAEKIDGQWVTHQWLKKAVLLSFRINDNQVIDGAESRYFDKVPMKFADYDEARFQKEGFRVVPPAAVRQGAFIARNTVLMPSYVNIGAYVDEGSMVDTWATVGSCAQIGKNVHLSGGVGIGGVLEPLQANPTIIEDNCFIGARSEVVEGVIVEEGSVISMGVYLGQSTKIYDRETGEVFYGRVPAGMEERQLIDSQRGQIAIGWLIVEDLVMVLTLVLLPAVAGMTEKGDVGLASLALDMGITIGKVVAFIAIMMLVGRRLVPWILSRSAATGSRELFTLSVLALALGIAFGAVELFDVSFALGAFFAGMVLNESELSHRAAHDTLPLRDAFAVLFFVSVGMLFDPMILLEQPLAVLATLAIIIFGKSAAAFFLVRMFGHSPRTALTIAASLAQIGEFAFILAGLGMALDLLPQAGQNLVLAGAIISIMLNPVLFTLLEKYLDKTETLDEQTLEEVLEDEKQIPVDICNHALLVGFGRVGSLLGEKLMAQGIPLVVIETSRTRVDELRARGIRAVLGNAANEEIMNLAHLDCARWLLLTIPNGYEAGEIVASAREKCPNIEIIARAHYDDEVEYIVERGANQVVMGEREIARAMLKLLETPPAGELITG